VPHGSCHSLDNVVPPSKGYHSENQDATMTGSSNYWTCAKIDKGQSRQTALVPMGVTVGLHHDLDLDLDVMEANH
jgi:hypothetical protein